MALSTSAAHAKKYSGWDADYIMAQSEIVHLDFEPISGRGAESVGHYNLLVKYDGGYDYPSGMYVCSVARVPEWETTEATCTNAFKPE